MILLQGIDTNTQKAQTIIAGDLPWDRYYGNYVSIKIANQNSSVSNIENANNNNEPKIIFNIPVRVLHSIR